MTHVEVEVRALLDRHVDAVQREDLTAYGEVVRPDPIGMFELHAIGVCPEFQGQGVGRQLVSHGLDVARSEGFKCVEGSVFADNARMLRLLLSAGFRPVRIDYHRRADGADVVVMQKVLSGDKSLNERPGR